MYFTSSTKSIVVFVVTEEVYKIIIRRWIEKITVLSNNEPRYVFQNCFAVLCMKQLE